MTKQRKHQKFTRTTNYWKLKIVLIPYKNEIPKNCILLDTATNIDLTRFLTKRWIKIYDQSGRNYSFNKEIRMKTPILNECIVNDLLLLTNIVNIFYLIFLSLKILLILVMNISA